MVPPRTDAADAVDAAVERSLARIARDFTSAREPGAEPSHDPVRVAVALSGGRDSMVLLDAAARARHTAPVSLCAVHVHHGLSANADAWAEFCGQQCADRAVPLRVERIVVRRRGGDSLEAEARRARAAALLRIPADAILMAHHGDDQAETLLLQLLRGAGPRGLAAMSASRVAADGPLIARPLLQVSGGSVAAYARRHALAWVEDESNADTRIRRNALRHRVVPALREAFPGYPLTLQRAAEHQAEAAGLLDELAALDATALCRIDAIFGLALERGGFAALAARHAPRARNLLRWYLRQHGLEPPSTARLAELLKQCQVERVGNMRFAHGGVELGWSRGWLVVHAAASGEATSLPWTGQPHLDLPGGTLRALSCVGDGIAAELVAHRSLEVRARCGGERLLLAERGPGRAVSAFFRASATPAWERKEWPLVWDRDVLVAVPGLGVDARYRTRPAAAGYALEWEPRR